MAQYMSLSNRYTFEDARLEQHRTTDSQNTLSVTEGKVNNNIFQMRVKRD